MAFLLLVNALTIKLKINGTRQKTVIYLHNSKSWAGVEDFHTQFFKTVVINHVILWMSLLILLYSVFSG